MTESLIERFLNSLLDHQVHLRYAFFIVLFLCIYIDGYIFPDVNLIGIYLIPLTIAGFAFYNMTWIRIFITSLITLVRYIYAPNHIIPSISAFIFQLLTYYIVTEAMSGLIRHRIRDKVHTLNLTIALAKTLDSRDTYTAFHSENVANYALMIANEMKLSKTQCDDIYIGGRLHDIGKIGVPETILIKPSKLNDDEFEKIKQHPVVGYETLKHISLFKKNGILDMILYHHERYDGRGYPKGLKGEQIPKVARIMALADSFDAMTSRRIYRHENDLEHAISEIRKNRGTQFDPEIADIFLGILEKNQKSFIRTKAWKK